MLPLAINKSNNSILSEGTSVKLIYKGGNRGEASLGLLNYLK